MQHLTHAGSGWNFLENPWNLPANSTEADNLIGGGQGYGRADAANHLGGGQGDGYAATSKGNGEGDGDDPLLFDNLHDEFDDFGHYAGHMRRPLRS